MGPVTCARDENAEGKIIKGPEPERTQMAGGMGKIFFSKMLEYGDLTAQIDGITGEKDSYASLLTRSIRTAIAMRQRGITPEDIVTICTFNHLNSCVPLIASLFLGAKTANLDPTISLTDTIFLLQQVYPKIIFVSPEAVKLIQDAVDEAKFDTEIVVFGSAPGYCGFEEFLKPSSQEKDFKPIEVKNNKDTAIIFFSSGTTGLPKGICITHFGLLGQGYVFRDVGYNIDVFLAFASMYWISSALIITSCILTKGCRVLVPRFDPVAVWHIIDRFQVTSMFLAPSQAVAMYKKGRPEGINTSSFSELLIGGGPASNDQMKDVRDILPGTNVMLGYGQTEVSGVSTAFQPKNRQDMLMLYEKPGSSGRPMPGISYKVVDIETEELLGPNQRGELRVKTEFQMKGYYKRDSSEAWDSDGWLRTGDVVYYDEDHCFYIVDRVKDMLKFQSWHVPPAQLESVLLTHPAIKSAVVVGIADPEDGDHPLGVVVLENSCVGDISERDIEEYVAKRVHDRMRLRAGVRFIETIPTTPTGKMKRRDIRDMILRGEL